MIVFDFPVISIDRFTPSWVTVASTVPDSMFSSLSLVVTFMPFLCDDFFI